MEKKKRNVNVELARIIACLMVIAIHTELSVNPNGEWDPSRTLIAILIGDAVAIFWMITGAFLFEGKTDYKRVLARTAKTVLVPMLIWSLCLRHSKNGHRPSVTGNQTASDGKLNRQKREN